LKFKPENSFFKSYDSHPASLNLLPQAPKYIGVKLTGKLSGWTSPKVCFSFDTAWSVKHAVMLNRMSFFAWRVF
jgi:hypothetical protein